MPKAHQPGPKNPRSKVRDKPSHSRKGGGVERMTVKKGGAGARAWGKPGDELNYVDDRPYLNENDPNYDPTEEMEAPPRNQAQARFVESAADLSSYKQSIKDALREYLSSDDEKEFTRIVVELDMTVFHQELTKIIVTKGLDHNPQNRAKLSHLLAHLHLEGHLTPSQSKAGFLKIYHRLDELLVDSPNAIPVLKEFTEHAVSNGFLKAGDVKLFEVEVKLAQDSKRVDSIKQRIKSIVTEYLSSEDVADTCQSIMELDAPALGFEVVKRLIYAACDGKLRDKELVSVFLGSQQVISQEQIAKGFSVLLGRTEDMFLDTPDIFNLLSAFIARAVVDEALPPSFVVRQDLTHDDMGYQVVCQAQALLKQPGASRMLSEVWGVTVE